MQKSLVVVVVLFIGLCLVLMPQIREAVVQANTLYAVGLREDMDPDVIFSRAERPVWHGAVSVGMGIVFLAYGAALAWRAVIEKQRDAS